MTEAIFGLLGVLVGSAVSWLQTYWNNKQTTNKSARYLAIRVVCILDKYFEDCFLVIRDIGQRSNEGVLSPLVATPGPPVFPNDVDWKSINHELMYKILSFPSEVENAEQIIKVSDEVLYSPNFEEWFEERKYWHSRLGLVAYTLSEELCKKYNILQKNSHLNLVEEMRKAFSALEMHRQKRIEAAKDFVRRTLGGKRHF